MPDPDIKPMSHPSVVSFSDGRANPADLNILRHVFLSGEVPDWYIPPERTLALVNEFNDRYRALQQERQDGNIGAVWLNEVRLLSSEFFAAWGTSSIYVLETCGVDNAIEMMELFAINRELIWDDEYVSYFDQLDGHINIFRGGSGCPADVLKGFSWSLREDFAQMFVGRSGDPVLLQAEVMKEDVLLVSFDSEMEIVPRPGSIMNITQIEVPLSNFF